MRTAGLIGDDGFGQALWQVDATVVTVGVAVLIFTLQSYVGRTPGTSLQLLVRATGLRGFLYLGVVALGLLTIELATRTGIGISLMLSLAILLLLFPVVTRSIQTVSSESSIDRALTALAVETEATERRVPFEIAATEILYEEIQALGLAYGGRPGQGYVDVRAGRAGYVYDIRLGRLRTAAAMSSAVGPVSLTVSLGDKVTARSVIGYVPVDLGVRGRANMIRAIQIAARP